MEQSLTIVVGTTPDYVVRIQEGDRTRQLLFVLDYRYAHSQESAETENAKLLFSHLEDYDETLAELERYLSDTLQKEIRFACFDCESLYLTARLAEHFQTPFPSSQSVLKSRNKYLSGRLWLKNRVATPGCGLASDIPTSLELFYRFGYNVVIKPVTGSGSELLFHCTDEEGIIKAVETIGGQLVKRKDNPLFVPIIDPVSSDILDPCRVWVVEEFIDGPEYSCDFFIHDNGVDVLRETGKIKDFAFPFGTVSGYTLPPSYGVQVNRDDIGKQMLAAARALGFEWGYFMADYILKNDRIYMIELTPRPGGDSLPDLIKVSSGNDILKTYMDMMGGNNPIPDKFSPQSERFASIHFYADRKGTINEIDTVGIESDPRFCFLELKKKKGDQVSLPPDDYDNRLLGYCVISSPEDNFSLSTCRDFQKRIKVTFTD